MRIVFFFNDTATTEIYTLSLHDALPISFNNTGMVSVRAGTLKLGGGGSGGGSFNIDASSRLLFDGDHSLSGSVNGQRSEKHTSELQSNLTLLCSLPLEKQKTYRTVKCAP